MTDFVVITPKDISTLADAIIERAAQGTAKSKSAVLNMIAATFMGPKHDWGFITGNTGEYLHSQRSSAKIDGPTSVKVSPMSDAIQTAAQAMNIEVKDVPAARAQPQDLIGMPSYPLAFDPNQVVTIARFAKGLTSERDLRIQAGDAGYAVRFVNLEDCTLSAFDEFGSEMFDTGENTVCVYTVTNKAIPAILRELGVYLKKIYHAPLFNRRAVVVNDSMKDLNRVLLRHMPQIFDFVDHIEMPQKVSTPTEQNPLIPYYAQKIATKKNKIFVLTGKTDRRIVSEIHDAASWFSRVSLEMRLEGLPDEAVLTNSPHVLDKLRFSWSPPRDDKAITTYIDIDRVSETVRDAVIEKVISNSQSLDYHPGTIVFTGVDHAAIVACLEAYGPDVTKNFTYIDVSKG
jgi:hypothetical protein